MEAQSVKKETYLSGAESVLMGKVPETTRSNMIRFGEKHMEWTLDDMSALCLYQLRFSVKSCAWKSLAGMTLFLMRNVLCGRPGLVF